MKKVLSIALVVSTFAFVATAAFAAADASTEESAHPVLLEGSSDSGPLFRHSSGSTRLAKALEDTFILYGGPGSLEGKFQTLLPATGGQADLQGWVGHDNTDVNPFWHLDTFNAELFAGPSGNHAMWSGVPVGTAGFSTAPGYGDNWDDQLIFERTVANPSVSHAVRLQFEFNYDVEPAFDFFDVDYDSAGTWVNIASYTGTNADLSGVFSPIQFDETINYAPQDFAGDDFDQIRLRLRVTSDGGWSDEDGLWDTIAGAAQVDNITVSLDGSPISVADFEGAAGDGDWNALKAPFVGDFAKVFQQFNDIDPCRGNITPVAGFLDDGTPPSNGGGQSTGGTLSGNWSYGIAGGWVTNYDGGLTFGSDYYLNNDLRSPEILWDDPSTTDDDALVGGGFLRFDAYTHLPRLNGMRWSWGVRSFPNSEGNWTAWQNRNFVYFNDSATWTANQIDFSDLIVQNPERVQVRLQGLDFAEIFGYPGGDATPAPIYDNVTVAKYQAGGPAHSQRTIDPFMDSFPNNGSIFVSDAPGDLEALALRIDMTNEINSGTLAVAGDSMIVDVVPVIPGTALAGPPSMHWVLDANPLFDSVRGAGLTAAGATSAGTFTGRDGRSWNRWTGTVVGTQSTTSVGNPIADRYYFDLPDGPAAANAAYQVDEPALFFPGDVIRYYMETSDTGGNTTTLPANTVGFLDGSWGIGGRSFTIRGLPSYLDEDSDGVPTQPEILVINDFGRRGGENDFVSAMNQNGLLEGVGFDTYTSNAPSSSVTDGIGSAGLHGANAQQLEGYDVMFYFTGNLSNAMSDGVQGGDKANDIEVLTQWHALDGDRFMVHMGDNFASTMNSISSVGQTYLIQVCGVQSNDRDVRDEIDNQTAPKVVPTGAAAGVFATEYVAFGGCLSINTFDSIQPLGGAVRSHAFVDPNGSSSSYAAAAGVWYDRNQTTSGGTFRRVDVTFPYGLIYVWDSTAKAPAGSSARALLVQELLEGFGKQVNDGGATPVPSPRAQTELEQANPNPFNPSTTLAFRIGEKGVYSLKVYNLRGELVRTLVQGELAAGRQEVVWNGQDDRGASVASGVYVYRLEGRDFSDSKKMALVK